ncbi:MAG: hypothetical protein R6V56_08400 [Lentisphaeria bacterium]
MQTKRVDINPLDVTVEVGKHCYIATVEVDIGCGTDKGGIC